MKFQLRVCALIVLLLDAAAARAQFYMGETIFTMPVLVLDTKGYATPDGKSGAGITGKSGLIAASPATFSYQPKAAQQAETVRAYAASLEKANPTAAQGIRTSFGPGKTDYNTVYRNIVNGAELLDSDAADATTAFFALALLLVENPDQRPYLPAEACRGLRQQLTHPLSRTAATPAAVAQLGEEMKLRTVLLYAAWLGAQQKHTVPAFQQNVVDVFQRQYRLDLHRYQLISKGMMKK